MNDQLVAEVFKELAVLQGKRTPTGKWEKDVSIIEFRNLLRQATIIVKESRPEEV